MVFESVPSKASQEDRYGVGVAAVKYWVIDNDTLHETDGDESGKYGDLFSLASRLAVGDGVLRALYDTVSQSANIVAVGRVESVDPHDGKAAIDWQSAEFTITPGPNGRRHWEHKPYFMLKADRALAYELPSKFAAVFDDRDRLGASAPTEELAERALDSIGPKQLDDECRYLDEYPIEVLNLSNRGRNCMKRAGIGTVGELTLRTEVELLIIPNLGVGLLNEIQTELQRFKTTLSTGNWDRSRPAQLKSRQGCLQNVSSEDDEPIQLLELGDSLVALLERNGIRGVAELVAHSREELGMIPGLGELKLLRIEAVLESSGWRLGDIGSFLEGRNEFRAGLAEQVRREAENKRQEDERERREATSLVWPLVSRGLRVEQIVESTLLSRSAVVEARTAWMSEKRSAGASLKQIGDAVGLSRERVRQLLERAGLPSFRETRTQLRDQRDLEEVLQAERLRGLILDIAKSMPGSSVGKIAREVGVSESVVRRHLTRMGTKLVCELRLSKTAKNWSNEQLLDVLRIASTKSTPLTVTAYSSLVTQKQVDGPTGQVFYMRFGSWLEACEAAGVQSGERVRSNYTRAWLDVDLEALVVEFLFSIERDGSFGDFQAWLQERPDSPSVATVRKRLGTWNEMKRKAIEQIVASGRLTELLDVCE